MAEISFADIAENRTRGVPLLIAALALMCDPADAQQVREARPDAEIVVTGRRAEPSPSIIDQYSEENIAGFGAITIGEVIDRLERRNNGRPFSIVVNGRRLTDISDLREIPPEALAKVEILAESSAVRFGFSATNKVLNLVLKSRFTSRNADAGLRLPTEGGAKSGSTALRYTNIRGETRFNASVNVSETAALNGRDRLRLFGVGVEDALLPYRTLQPSTRSASLTVGLAIPLNSNSINLSATVFDARSRQLGRFVRSDVIATSGDNLNSNEPPAARGVVDTSYSRTYQVGASASGVANRLTWGVELNGSIAESRANSSVLNKEITGLPADWAQSNPGNNFVLNNSSKSASLGFTLNVNTPIFSLPAGQVIFSSKFSINTQRSASFDASSNAARSIYSQTQSRVNTGLYIPVSNRTVPVIGVLGQLSFLINGGYEHASDLGGYRSYDAGIDWQPTNFVTFSFNKSKITNAPALDRVRQPPVITSGALVVDVFTGQYVLATQISGGAPGLEAAPQATTTTRLNFNKSINETRISAALEYSTTRIKNPIVSVAYPSAFFQQVFPNRFVRNSSGRLQTIDLRPFNAVSERRAVITPSLHVSGRTGDAKGLNETENSETNWDIGINGEWALSDVLLPSLAQPSVDLLKTPFDGVQGIPQYKINIETSAARKGVNVQLSVRWRSGSKIDDVSGMTRNPIMFSAFWTANAETAVTIRRPKRTGHAPTPLRISFSIENLLNRRPDVRDASGRIPAAFQPAFLDPIGRVFAVRLRLPL